MTPRSTPRRKPIQPIDLPGLAEAVAVHKRTASEPDPDPAGEWESRIWTEHADAGASRGEARPTPSIPVGPGTRWDCIHPEEARRTNVIEEPTIYEVCSRCEAVLAIRQEARPTPVEPEAPSALEQVRRALTARAAVGKLGYHEAMQCVEMVESRLAVEPDGLTLDVPRLARAIPEDAVAPYSDWERENLARHIAREYSVGAPSEDGQPR